MPTQDRAEWAAELFRPHDAFRDGKITVEVIDDYTAALAGCYAVMFRGPQCHTGMRWGVEPLDIDDDCFDAREDAERACEEARRQIRPGDLSAIRVESQSDSGPWHLVWMYAAIQHPGHPNPRTPQRPGS
jgi:hypothetical protein